MIRLFVILLFVLLSFIPAQIPIAVLDLSAEGISGSEARTLTDRLRTELFNTGKYKVIEREMMDDILTEQGLQQSGCTSTECIVEVGRLIGVEQVVGGSIGKVGNVYSISARTISVETGQILRVATYDHTGELGDLLRFGMKNVALVLSNKRTQTDLYLTTSFPQQEQKIIEESYQDNGIRDRGISINPAGILTQLFTDFQLYGLMYEQFVTPRIALSLRLDYIKLSEKWDEGDYYGDFSAEGFSLGASLLYYFSNTGRMNGLYTEVAVELLSTHWENIEYDVWGGETSKEGEGGFAFVVGGGGKIPIGEKYYFNPHLLLGIGSMNEISFIAFPALSVGMMF